MLSSILTAVVGLVVFSVWLYGVKIWCNNLDEEQRGLVLFVHVILIGFLVSFVVGLYSLSSSFFQFAENFIAKSFRKSEIDVNHFLETIGKDSASIEGDKIFFHKRAVVDTKSLTMTLKQKSGETKTFNISKSDLKKILPVANNGVKMNFYDAIASSLEIENK